MDVTTIENGRILVYRRTHTGDPNPEGVFGINDCMGSVRNWSYDAVIGIGGIKPDPGYENIKKKITWVSISPKKPATPASEADKNRLKKDAFGGSLITFEKFKLWDEKGILVSEISKKLSEYMFDDRKIPRHGKNFPKNIHSELIKILVYAKNQIENDLFQLNSRYLSNTNVRIGRGCK